MAYKIVHRTREQQVLFANRSSARRYAERYGGGQRWHVTEAGVPPVSSVREAGSGYSPKFAELG